jgi:DNA-binding IclR family transcriptional regulator
MIDGQSRGLHQPRQPTGSVALRSLAVLEELAIAPQTAAEIARRFDVNRSTSLRLLKEMELGGYVCRDPTTLQYRVLPHRFYSFVENSEDHRDIIKIVNPLLASLGEQTAEATMLGVPAPNSMVYMAYHPSAHAVAVRERIGTVRPIHSSALGKAYLSTLTPEQLDQELETLSFQGGTEKAAQNANALREDVEAARERGFALDVEETFIGGSCVAAPIRIDGDVIGSIGISGPASRLELGTLTKYGALIVADLAEVESTVSTWALH